MNTVTEQKSTQFVDRRQNRDSEYSGPNRRQFRDSHDSLRPEVKELAEAVDEYKAVHRRRFITYEELLSVIEGLGYHK